MKFKKGDKVKRLLHGPGPLISKSSATVLGEDAEGVWLDNGPGNDPSGPFNPKTGVGATIIYGVWQQIEPRAKKKGRKKKGKKNEK